MDAESFQPSGEMLLHGVSEGATAVGLKLGKQLLMTALGMGTGKVEWVGRRMRKAQIDKLAVHRDNAAGRACLETLPRAFVADANAQRAVDFEHVVKGELANFSSSVDSSRPMKALIYSGSLNTYST